MAFVLVDRHLAQILARGRNAVRTCQADRPPGTNVTLRGLPDFRFFKTLRWTRPRESASVLLMKAAMDNVSVETRRRADGDQRLADMASSAQSLREERDRLARRLADLERELANLASRLGAPAAFPTPSAHALRRA